MIVSSCRGRRTAGTACSRLLKGSDLLRVLRIVGSCRGPTYCEYYVFFRVVCNCSCCVLWLILCVLWRILCVLWGILPVLCVTLCMCCRKRVDVCVLRMLCAAVCRICCVLLCLSSRRLARGCSAFSPRRTIQFLRNAISLN